jgi:hypothetical protein
MTPVSASLTGLVAKKTYCYQVVVSSSAGGISYGAVASFATN